MTVRELLLARADDAGPGLLWDGGSWTWAEYVARASQVAGALRTRLDPERPRHVGAYLDNGPEMALLLAAAGLGGFTLVGLNTTRRGTALADDVRRTDCQIVIAVDADLPVGVPVIAVGSPSWDALADGPPIATDEPVNRDDLMMLIFTSGTSGNPKAVRITQEKVAHPGRLLGERFGLGPDDVAYLSMPLFHSNAVMAGWAPALATGAAMAVARFSAGGFLRDVRRFGATYANYVGKPLSYVLATPEAADDADNPLRLVFGNEAAARDIDRFAQRFGCTVVDSYSSTENAIVVQRVPDMPPGALGRPLPGVKVLDPQTGRETPDALVDADGRLLNAVEATGELVNTSGAGFFAGYYNDPSADAARMRGGMYWSGDLAYRDADGFVFFAGRSHEWLRVDGENLGTAPIERILLRHPDVVQAAVYAVPDETGVGDQVMAALVLRPERPWDADAFAAFLDDQADLGAKARPRYLRIASALPRTPTHKVLTGTLRTEGILDHADPVWARPARGTAYSLLERTLA